MILKTASFFLAVLLPARFLAALPPMYAITDLGPILNSLVDGPQDLNARGQAALTRDGLGYIWTKGVLTPSVGISSNGLAMNDLGHLAYVYHSQGWLWRSGVIINIGKLEPNVEWTVPEDVNNSDVVVGETLLNSNQKRHGFIWENGIMQDIGSPLPNIEVSAFAINDSRQVVGEADERAFLWENQHFTDLPPLSTMLQSSASDINELGFVVGYSAAKDSHLKRATLWKDGQAIDLGSVHLQTYSYANGINKESQVVGKMAQFYTAIDDLSHAFIWEAGELHDLNNLVPFDSGWILNDAVAINNSGLIIGWGSFNNARHDFLLTPLPEPTTLIAPIILSIVLTCRRRYAVG